MSPTVCTRTQFLANARLIVIKIGSAVLTDHHGLNLPLLQTLAAQITTIKQRIPGRNIILVSSGAVAAGRRVLSHYQLPSPATTQTARQALAAIGQGSLMHAWNEAFSTSDQITAQVLLTRDDFRIRERFQHAANTFTELLVWGAIPIVNENDTVAVHELQFGDNDTLASLLVNLVNADLFVNLTSAAGVLGQNPENHPDAPVLSVIPTIEKLNFEELCGKKTALGSGGMYSKLLAARRVAQLGVPTLIIPGKVPNILLDAFSGTQVGTWICPNTKTIPRRKYWLAYQSSPQGTLFLDQGAANALLHEGRSLLPGGITSIEGEFQKGDLVRIMHGDELLGVGFSNYPAAELHKIIGHKRHEIAAILGNPKYPDVIHRDNLLLDAAL